MAYYRIEIEPDDYDNTRGAVLIPIPSGMDLATVRDMAEAWGAEVDKASNRILGSWQVAFEYISFEKGPYLPERGKEPSDNDEGGAEGSNLATVEGVDTDNGEGGGNTGEPEVASEPPATDGATTEDSHSTDDD